MWLTTTAQAMPAHYPAGVAHLRTGIQYKGGGGSEMCLCHPHRRRAWYAFLFSGPLVLVAVYTRHWCRMIHALAASCTCAYVGIGACAVFACCLHLTQSCCCPVFCSCAWLVNFTWGCSVARNTTQQCGCVAANRLVCHMCVLYTHIWVDCICAIVGRGQAYRHLEGRLCATNNNPSPC